LSGWDVFNFGGLNFQGYVGGVLGGPGDIEGRWLGGYDDGFIVVSLNGFNYFLISIVVLGFIDRLSNVYNL
jgi:hypothetical protein